MNYVQFNECMFCVNMNLYLYQCYFFDSECSKHLYWERKREREREREREFYIPVITFMNFFVGQAVKSKNFLLNKRGNLEFKNQVFKKFF